MESAIKAARKNIMNQSSDDVDTVFNIFIFSYLQNIYYIGIKNFKLSKFNKRVC